MQDYFQLLIHAQQCRSRCARRRICSQTQAHLQHYANCRDRMCQYLNCFKARLLLNHYRTCSTSNCKICPPRYYEYKPRYTLCSLLRMLFGTRRDENTDATATLLTEAERQRITTAEATEALLGIMPDPNDQEDIKLTSLLRDLAETHQELEKKSTETQTAIEKIVQFRAKRQLSKTNQKMYAIPKIPKELMIMGQKALGQYVELAALEGGEASTHSEPLPHGDEDSFCEYKSTGGESDVEGFDECEQAERDVSMDEKDDERGSTSSKDDSSVSADSSISIIEEAAAIEAAAQYLPDTSSSSSEWEVLVRGHNGS